MRSLIITFIALVAIKNATAQTDQYKNDIKIYQQDYVRSHEVVKGKDKKLIGFYPISADYNVTARFEKNNDTATIAMKTSGIKIPVKNFTRYGKIYFKYHDTALILTVYRSAGDVARQYKDYLFIPFTDMTSGNGSYGGGRYIDILTTDIKNAEVNIDLNKAYNPYCAYTTGYNCPIPPRENNLPIYVIAGERDYGKKH
jgi:uncharacterized protein (DUF1684 family)